MYTFCLNLIIGYLLGVLTTLKYSLELVYLRRVRPNLNKNIFSVFMQFVLLCVVVLYQVNVRLCFRKRKGLFCYMKSSRHETAVAS